MSSAEKYRCKRSFSYVLKLRFVQHVGKTLHKCSQQIVKTVERYNDMFPIFSRLRYECWDAQTRNLVIAEIGQPSLNKISQEFTCIG